MESAVARAIAEPSQIAAAAQDVFTACFAAIPSAPAAAFVARPAEFAAPDIDHVAETMVEPVTMTDGFFGEMYSPEGYLDKTTELGDLTTRVAFSADPAIPAYDRFVKDAPLIVAAR